MKLLILLGFILACGGASAQPLEEVAASDTIELRVQQTRTFVFDKPFKEIKTSASGVADIVPESDKIINMHGLTQGQTLMTAYASDGRVIYRANISVLQQGGLVKIYGQGNGRAKDYVSYYCTEYGCGRGDNDVPPTPSSTTITEQGQNGTTISREYR